MSTDTFTSDPTLLKSIQASSNIPGHLQQFDPRSLSGFFMSDKDLDAKKCDMHTFFSLISIFVTTNSFLH